MAQKYSNIFFKEHNQFFNNSFAKWYKPYCDFYTDSTNKFFRDFSVVHNFPGMIEIQIRVEFEFSYFYMET